MIADENIFNGPKMNPQTTEDQMAEIEKKINDGDYDLMDTDSEKSVEVKDKEDLFFATEIETNYVEPPKP